MAASSGGTGKESVGRATQGERHVGRQSAPPRVWLTSYPQGVPAEIDCSKYASLVDLFEQSAARYANRPAFTNLGITLTYQGIEAASRTFATFLQQALGLPKGERVAVMMPNLLQYPVAVFGILRAGLVVVNTNPLYTPRELRHQLVDSGASAIVILENFAHVLEKVLADTPVKTVITTRVGDLLGWRRSVLVNFVVKYARKQVPPFKLTEAVAFRQALAIGAERTLEKPPLGSEDIAFLQYTGGTTGVAKGAMLTHGNMVANTLQSVAWHTPALRDEAEVVITALPLYHIFALTINCLTFIKMGGLSHLITNPRDMPGFVKELGKTRFTCITGVNTLFNGLLHTPGFAELDFSALKLSIGGGMALQQSVAERWKEVTNCPLIEGYGLTETSPLACANPLDIKGFSGSIGVPVPSTDCSIQDEQGRFLPPGTAGELCFRGPQVMKGYWNRPDETVKVLSGDRWLRTGDIAQMDERGFVKIVDRKKDMIIVSGFKVYPNEIEAVLAAHPGVLEAAAVGVTDSQSGEAVKIVVVKKDQALTADELIRYCKENLAGYKSPKHVEFREELPKSNVGKVLRRELRQPQSASV